MTVVVTMMIVGVIGVQVTVMVAIVMMVIVTIVMMIVTMMITVPSRGWSHAADCDYADNAHCCSDLP